MTITAAKLKEARKLAEAHKGKASRIILALTEEVERLRRLTLRRGLHPVGVLEPWPYGEHRGKDFHEVPEDYLVAWAKERRRDVLDFDIKLGLIAQRDLQLFDLICKLSSKPAPPPEPPSEHDMVI